MMHYICGMNNELYDKWLVQLRKGYLELSVLCALKNSGKAYGLQIMQVLERAGIDVNEGTLYPLLNRMHKNGWLESSWETQTDSGHPRRFYSLSSMGLNLLPKMLDTFQAKTHSLKVLEKLT